MYVVFLMRAVQIWLIVYLLYFDIISMPSLNWYTSNLDLTVSAQYLHSYPSIRLQWRLRTEKKISKQYFFMSFQCRRIVKRNGKAIDASICWYQGPRMIKIFKNKSHFTLHSSDFPLINRCIHWVCCRPLRKHYRWKWLLVTGFLVLTSIHSLCFHIFLSYYSLRSTPSWTKITST